MFTGSTRIEIGITKKDKNGRYRKLRDKRIAMYKCDNCLKDYEITWVTRKKQIASLEKMLNLKMP